MRRKETDSTVPPNKQTADSPPRRPLERFPALNALLLCIVFNFTLQPLTEPDFGWHLRTGLDVLSGGWTLPSLDPYSHTMSDWAWVEHAWLTDVIIGGIYSVWGGSGIIVLFGAVSAAAWLLAAGTASCGTAFRQLACILSLWVALPYLGARTQLVTLLGLALLLLMVKRWQNGERWPRWCIPPLFLLWANLHGGFAAGLFLLGLILAATAAVRWLSARRLLLSSGVDETLFTWSDLRLLMFVMGCAFVVTFLNPYGWRLHGEIVDSLSNRFMLETLQEWQPLSIHGVAGRSYVIYLAGLGAAAALWYRRVEPVRWVIGGTFLLLSLRHMRNIPFFLLVSLPLCAELAAAGFDRLGRRLPVLFQRAKIRGLAGAVAAAAMLTWTGPEHLQHVAQSGARPAEYFRATSYPIEAVEWVRDHRNLVGQRLFNEYGHGGFLLWWLPGEKIFIDGRMPTWQRGDRRIFRDYVALTASDPPDLTVLAKYSVDWAIVRRESPLDRRLAQEAVWSRVYDDRKVSIYRLATG